MTLPNDVRAALKREFLKKEKEEYRRRFANLLEEGLNMVGSLVCAVKRRFHNVSDPRIVEFDRGFLVSWSRNISVHFCLYPKETGESKEVQTEYDVPPEELEYEIMHGSQFYKPKSLQTVIGSIVSVLEKQD